MHFVQCFTFNLAELPFVRSLSRINLYVSSSWANVSMLFFQWKNPSAPSLPWTNLSVSSFPWFHNPWSWFWVRSPFEIFRSSFWRLPPALDSIDVSEKEKRKSLRNRRAVMEITEWTEFLDISLSSAFWWVRSGVGWIQGGGNGNDRVPTKPTTLINLSQ